MKTSRLCCLLLFLFVCFSSCQGKKQAKLIRLITEWQGKEIRFQEEVHFTRFLTDTVFSHIPDTDYKVLVYIDSAGCVDCRTQLTKWKDFILFTDSAASEAVSFLFFFHPKSEREAFRMLKYDNFDYPVCIDLEDSLNKLNQFPQEIEFQSFLLDRENKVVVIGNPIQNPAVKYYYLEQITGKTQTASTTTTAVTRLTEIDAGLIQSADTARVSFYIENTGDRPLVIIDTGSSCSCVQATYEREAAVPGDSLQVNVSIHSQKIGRFEEKITVKCNTKQPIQVIITGQTH